MKRRQRSHAGISFSLQTTFLFLLSVLLLLPISSASARNNEAGGGVSPAVHHAVPLMKPIVEPADYPGRGLHFGDPVDVTVARMTSGYGWRMHPVLKVKKLHRGIDYAAPAGTPVHATEDGIVDMAGWRGNYGKLVTIKHSDLVKTFYAHLSDFAPGIRAGVGVKKGDVIGYIGRTGLATGNHLYYEVVVNDERIDPLADDLNEQVNVLAASVVRPDARKVAQTRSQIESAAR